MTYLFLFLSALGFLDSAYLTIQHYSRDPFACPLFGGCEEVTSSIYSEIFGIPTALLGVLYYGTIFLLSIYSFLKEDKKIMTIASQLTIAGVLASLYLVYIQVYVLSAICFYCILSAISSTLLFVIGALHLNKLKKFELKFIFDYFSKFSTREKIIGALRISLGFIFLWAFLSKAEMWLSGNHPAKGFLENGTRGIFAATFASGSENYLLNGLYMFGLFATGTALMLGITRRLATISGTLMMLFIYASSLPPANNPIVDEHIIYILLFLLLYFDKDAYSIFGFYAIWQKQKVVEKYKFLR